MAPSEAVEGTNMAKITDCESPDPDLDELFDIIRKGQQHWVEGQAEGIDQHERMSIYGPFGGPCPVLHRER